MLNDDLANELGPLSRCQLADTKQNYSTRSVAMRKDHSTEALVVADQDG
jgi:hypothetical protein